MSHFTVAVFTKEDQSVDELLAPYDEEIVFVPYVRYTREQAIIKVRKEIEDYRNRIYSQYLLNPEEYENNCKNKRHLDYLRNDFPKKLNWTDEECYQSIAKYYADEDKDEYGNIYSTYNPNSKWDWYEIGGRWNNLLKIKNGNYCNEAYVSELDLPDNFLTFAVILPNGKWYERGEMGWFAMVSNEKDDWDEKYKERFLDKAEPDWLLTIVDCHI